MINKSAVSVGLIATILGIIMMSTYALPTSVHQATPPGIEVGLVRASRAPSSAH